MKTCKKLIVAALAASVIASGAAGITSAVSSKADGEENYVASQEWKNELTVGGWVQFYDTSIKSYDDQVRDLAAAGMNMIDLPTFISAQTSYGSTGTKEFWDNLERLSEALNMYYFYQGSDVTEFESAYAKVKDYARCIGYHLKDEPSSAQMDSLAEICRSFKEKDPSRMAYVNLFPSYAGATNLGGTYRDYVTKWANLYGSKYPEDMFYFDHYPFTQTEDVRSTYFSDLEVIRDIAYKNGKLLTGGFTQMGSWNGMVRPTADMARWSTYSLLTYGLKSISHFCWVAPQYVSPENGGEGMRDFVTDSKGNRTDLYEPMSILNWQIRQLGYVLTNVDVKHAYHTAKVPTGAEGLPSGFLMQPANESDSFIYSIAYSKDKNEPYLLVFNKALSGEAKDYTFNFDLSSGIKSMRYYKPTDYTFDNLPDPSDLSTLEKPEEVLIDVSSGTMTASFKPGEMKIFKLEGENGAPVEIFEDLQIPESSHQSGVYVGPQKISLMTGDKGATIYYTTDGSYPEPGSETTRKYDGTLIEIGKYDETATYSVRAVSVRGTDVSGILDIDLIIANASRNAASGKIVKLLSADLTREVGFEGFNGASSDLRHVTDGSFDPFSSVIKTSEPAWAVLDLGEMLTLDKFTFSFWHDWWFGKNELKVATKEDLSDAKRIWYEDAMQNVPGSGTTITLDEPVSARYVMLYNDCKGEGQCSMFTELQAYTAYGAGENLIADTENWTSLKNGDFTNDGKTIKENTPYQRDNWDKAYSYNAKTYKNFMIDATMRLDVTDPGAWGYAGFTIFREDTNVTQGMNGKGLTVGIEPKGRVLLWNGSREVGPLDANIVGWSVNGTFDIKIVAYEGTISVAINGRPVMNVYNSEYVGKEGYISLHSGLLPITVTKLGITEIDESFAFPKKGAAVSAADDTKLAIERYVAEKDVIGALGTTVGITDTNGKKHTVGVEWKADGYDRTKTGNFDFIGVLSADDLKAAGVSNVYNVKAYATVFIRSEIDDSVSRNLLSVAASLHENEYTAESWEYLQLKVEAMNSILNNKFLVQSDVNVGMFQLYDAIYKYLVYAGDTAELDEAIAKAEALDKTAYTDYSYADFDKVLKEAKEYAAQSLKTFAGIKAQAENLAKAEKKLVKTSSVAPVFDGEKPEIKDIPGGGAAGCSSSAGGFGVTAALGAAAAVVIKRKKRGE